MERIGQAGAGEEAERLGKGALVNEYAAKGVQISALSALRVFCDRPG